MTGTHTCSILPPRPQQVRSGYNLPNSFDLGCILPLGNCYAHVFRLPNGQHVAWEDDFKCGCCEPDDEQRCIMFREISQEEVEELMR
ncbi:MAG TPA: hypothetical protein VGB97_00240 [Candidatus Paceibacterota bacterium]|jgi:hypothetical protein